MREMDRWLANYEAKRVSKQGKELKESWVSSKFDFTDPNVRLEYVPEMGCSVGGCISALKRSWTAYRIAGRNGEPRGDLAYRINRLKTAMGLEPNIFPELEGIDDDYDDQELTPEELEAKRDEEKENGGEEFWSSEVTDEWSELDKRLLREEKVEEDDWWFR